MQCPRCHYELDENANFCPHCGMKIIRCPECHAPNLEEANFCQHCGHKLKVDTPQYQSPYHYQPVRDLYEGEAVDREEINDDMVVDDPNIDHTIHWKKVIMAFLVMILAWGASYYYLATSPKIALANEDGVSIASTFKASKMNEAERLSNLSGSGLIAKSGKYTYMTDDTGYLIRVDENFKHQTEITTEPVNYINAVGDYLYYTNASHQICSYNLKTKEKRTIVTNNSYYVVATKDVIYYQNDSDQESLYAYDIASGVSKKLVNDHVYCINPVGDLIYYTTKNAICAYDTKSGQIALIKQTHAHTLVYNKECLYYVDDNGSLIVLDLKNKTSDTIASGLMGSALINDQYAYSYVGGKGIVRISLSDKKQEYVYKGMIAGYYDYSIIGNNLIVKENGHWVSVNTTNHKKGRLFK